MGVSKWNTAYSLLRKYKKKGRLAIVTEGLMFHLISNGKIIIIYQAFTFHIYSYQ